MDYGKLCRERTNMSMVKPRRTEVNLSNNFLPVSGLFIMKCFYQIHPFLCHTLQLILDDNGKGMGLLPRNLLIAPGPKVIVLSEVSRFVVQCLCQLGLGLYWLFKQWILFYEIGILFSDLSYELSLENYSRVWKVLYTKLKIRRIKFYFQIFRQVVQDQNG